MITAEAVFLNREEVEVHLLECLLAGQRESDSRPRERESEAEVVGRRRPQKKP